MTKLKGSLISLIRSVIYDSSQHATVKQDTDIQNISEEIERIAGSSGTGDTGGGAVDLSNYYTKDQVDSAIATAIQNLTTA